MHSRLRLLAHGRNVPDGTLILAESQTRRARPHGTHLVFRARGGLVSFARASPAHLARFRSTYSRWVVPSPFTTPSSGYTRVDVDIKWPNDLLVDGRKIAGILAEIQADLDRIHVLVIGVGPNVNHAAFLKSLPDRATSLRLASGHPHSRLDILLDFLEQFEGLIDRFHAGVPRLSLPSGRAIPASPADAG